MSVTAANILSLPVALLRALLADCTAFRTWAGASGGGAQAAALARVHLIDFLEPEQGALDEDAWRAARAACRPLAVVGMDGEHTGEEQAADEAYWHHRGGLTLLLEEISSNVSGVVGPSNDVSDADAILHLTNAAGAILEEMEAKNGASGYIKLLQWSLRSGPGRMDPKAVSGGELDVSSVLIAVNWAEV